VNQVSLVKNLTSEQVDEILKIVIQASEKDGARPFSEHVELHLRSGGDRPIVHLLAQNENNKIIGYGHLDTTDLVAGPSGEIVVEPESRQLGVATLIISEMKKQIGSQKLRLWSHGDTEVAKKFASQLGFDPVRTIVQMRRSLFSQIVPFNLSQDYKLRFFDIKNDVDNFLLLNKICFKDLPDQSSWTRKDLELRLAESWFDPNGFALIENQNKELVGFCWTKIHGQDHKHEVDDGHTHDSHGHQPIGEIYVLGVHPNYQGKGLGKTLTLWGLNYLRKSGLDSAMLYVDSNNKNAIDIYSELDFNYWGINQLYRTK
jgi:mycothiol synthase